jgi:predicted Zn-dependent protease
MNRTRRQSALHNLLASCMLLLLLPGCGPADHHRHPPDLFEFHRAGGVDLTTVELLYRVRSEIMAAAEVRADFRLMAAPEPNGFAVLEEGAPVVVITTGLVRLIGSNADEYAFVIAHECAHLAREHHQAQLRNGERLEKLGGFLLAGIECIGMAFGVPTGLLAIAPIETGTRLLRLKYDRDQEREADRLAIDFMLTAGYDPQGAIRFQEKIKAAATASRPALLSTHPADDERIAAIRALLAEKEEK